MTCEMTIIGSRNEDLTHEECIEYLEREHIPLVKELPGLKQFTTSVPLEPDRIGHPLDLVGTRYDVVVQLQFESLGDFSAAFDSDEGRRVLRDAENFIHGEESATVVVVDETLRYRAIPPHV